jgi:hypothetical protein
MHEFTLPAGLDFEDLVQEDFAPGYDTESDLRLTRHMINDPDAPDQTCLTGRTPWLSRLSS